MEFKGLFYRCRNFGKSGCAPQIRDLMLLTKENAEDDTKELPIGEELTRYVEICRRCDLRHFKAEDSKCLVCDEGTLEPLFLGTTKFAARIEFFYICLKCGTKYFTYEKLK